MATLPPVDRVSDAVKVINDRIRALSRQRSLPLLDFYSVLADADGRYFPGFTADGTHPTERAARLMGSEAVRVLSLAASVESPQ